MNLIFKEIITRQQWEAFIQTQPQANFLQSYDWGVFHQSLGKKVFFLGVYEKGHQIGACLTIKEIAKRGTALFIYGGPLICWQTDYLNSLFDYLVILAKKEGCSFIRFRPAVLNSVENLIVLAKSSHLIKRAPMYLTCELTTQLDLTLSLDQLLKNMRKNTRRIIKNQDKFGIRMVKSPQLSSFNKFFQFHLDLAKRQKFVPFKYQFLKKEFEAFQKDNQVLLIESWHDQKLIASAFVIFYNQEASYHYGVSSPENFKYQGSYFCQWEAIKEAKKRKLKRYNFWGIAPKEKTKHRFYNLSIFKRGFGGQEWDYLPTHDLIIKPLRYAFVFLVETVRKKVRSL